MSKMKHLLRKLHIGGGGGAGVSDQHQQRLPESRPHSSPSPSSSASSVPASPGVSSSAPPRARDGPDLTPVELGRTGGGGGGDGLGDFSFFEEEFQVQLALAISASDPVARQDAESVQIDAAKRISLGCPVGSHVTNYNIVNYDERVMDGFYDVYGIISNENFLQGKLPSLVDLQAISISDNVDYEVVLVNRSADPALQLLERTAQSIALECRAADLGPNGSGLVQKIADLVVDSMGGPVGDAEDMLRRWRTRSHELRTSLKTIVLPLGCLDIGLSRHRALLFKVLADRTGLPCRLVKGSYYTGTDEGAVNLIKIDQDCEYIIDLMGAPGALIPAEVPCTQLQTPTFDILSSTAISHSVKDLCSALDEKLNCDLPQSSGGLLGSSCHLSSVPTTVVSSVSADAAEAERLLTESNQTAKFERDFGNLLPPLGRTREESSGNKKVRSSTQKMKVKDVSKYVISAAQNPEFAQKLHAVLLESGASPPPDLFSDINLQHDLMDAKGPSQTCVEEANKTKEKPQVGSSILPRAGCKSSALADCRNERNFFAVEMPKNHISAKPGADVGHGCNMNVEGLYNSWIHDRSALTSRCREEYYEIPVQRCGSENEMTDYVACKENGYLPKRQDTGQDCTGKSVEVDNVPQLSANEASSNNRNPLLDDVAGYEIPWENLQLGERIGLGSFGEVYRADWNGTEVAVKKFLDQDFSGDALDQFRSEIKIMLRLRHPNVVLFMGAVTRPPNLSILTEFLPRGSLYRLLHRPKIQLDEKRRLKMALDVAKGMNYLHTSHPTIVHRDLKSPNLLVDKNWVVKVCDFGLSRLKHNTFLSSKSTAGTPEWMAPEVLRNELSNEKCDVYSFGVILWELATLRMPWSGMNPMQVVGAVGFQNRRLDIPKEVDSMVAQIILDCWHSEPNLRPSFSQLMGSLKQLKRLVTEET